jgi:signal recognition particle subunit SEC65
MSVPITANTRSSSEELENIVVYELTLDKTRREMAHRRINIQLCVNWSSDVEVRRRTKELRLTMDG